ncbi:MAG: hypothetical protein QG640_569 [Patescibacteria group bacterium]|nr:hypothetical protein [Patescibacteria group bacterium]
MNTYSKISPSIIGVLSDDHLYFEGLNRPAVMYTIRDGSDVPGSSMDTLEKYFNDVYNLFLRKLSAFTTLDHATNEETMKLQALLQELIKVKGLIEGVEATMKNGTKDADLL